MPPSADTPKIYIVEDDIDEREGLSFVLRSTGFVVGAYGTAESFLADHTPVMTGCLLVDVRLPAMDGVELINELHRKSNKLPVVAISGFAQTRLVVDAMRAGAVDFLEKPLDTTLLLSAVRSAMRGARTSVSLRSEAAVAAKRIATLSAREDEVFTRFSQGTSTKRIADDMGISPKTVETYRTRLLEKLGVDSPSALVRLGVLMAIYGSTPVSPGVGG